MMMDIYDIKSMKKIYSLKAYFNFFLDKGEKATIFTLTSEMITMKNFRSLF